MVLTNGQMEVNILATGKIIKCTGKVYINGQMEDYMMEIL